MRVFIATVLLALTAQAGPLSGRARRQGTFKLDRSAKRVVTPLEELLPNGRLPDTIPTIVDWRKEGFVTTPINFGECAGTMAADIETTVISSQIAIKNQAPVVPLSYQELVDCTFGCRGGYSLAEGFEWMIKHNSGNVDTAASYTSGSGKDKCNAGSGTVGATITKVVHLKKEEATMAQAVATMGPIAVVINAADLETYTSGVLTRCAAGYVDFGATLVGYNTAVKPAYWILKNSWGVDWGMDGYAYLAFGNNTCGVTTDPLTAKVKFA